MRDWVALFIAWLTTAWLLIVLEQSVVNFTRAIDVFALGIGLAMQLIVAVLWSWYPRLPLWLVWGHGLIMFSLAIGLLIAGPSGPLEPTAFGLALPWLAIGLLPAGLAMVVAAAIRWRPAPAHALH